MNKKLELSIFIVIGIIVVTLLGTTFAYFFARTSNSGNTITGQTYNFGASINSTTIYRATNLVPLKNNLVSTAISKETNKCIDKNNRDVCSLYSVTLSNSGETVILTPYITTTNSTYTTYDLKCQLYNNNFEAISDIITLPKTTDEKVYITNSSNNINISLASTNQTYYLVVWLTDTLSSQTEDYSKTYSGTITFEAGNSGQLYVDFTA